MSPESKDRGETTLRIRQQFRSTTILIPAYGSPGGSSLSTKCISRCDTCKQYANACGMSLCTTQPSVGSHTNTFVTHTHIYRPGGFSLLTQCNSDCDTCKQYASACGMSLCTTQPFVRSHTNTFVTLSSPTTHRYGSGDNQSRALPPLGSAFKFMHRATATDTTTLCLSRSKQNARKHGARTEHVRSTLEKTMKCALLPY